MNFKDIRSISALLFVFSLFLIVTTWQQEHLPKPVVPSKIIAQQNSNNSNNSNNLNNTANNSNLNPNDILGTEITFHALENNLMNIKISSKGASIIGLDLKNEGENNQSFPLMNEQTGFKAESGLTNAQAPQHDTNFVLDIAQSNKEKAVFSATKNGLKLTKTISVKKNSYQVEVLHQVTNLSNVAQTPQIYTQIARNTSGSPDDSQFMSSYAGPVVFSDSQKYQKVDMSDIVKGKKDLHTDKFNANEKGWIGFVQHYFITSWIPQTKGIREIYTNSIDPAHIRIGATENLATIQPNTTTQLKNVFFAAPQKQDLLKETAEGMDLVVDYGWLSFVAKPLFWLLNFLNGLIGNWGWAIIALTLLVKLALYPLSSASAKSMAQMKKIAPQLESLKQKYGEDRMKLAQAMNELYKKEKVSPAGGCLPMFLQIPIFIGFYWMIQSCVELRHAPWILWITDLSAKDIYYVLPVIMFAATLLQLKLNPKPADPNQAKIMMGMQIVFGVMYFFFPAGLLLYWITSTGFGLVQQHINNKRFAV